MDILVYSRSMIEAIAPQEAPHVIISITSHESDRARLREGALCRGVLRKSFIDSDGAVPGAEYPKDARVISEEDGVDIWAFVNAHLASIERIVVHCDAGVSRSAGVAAALAKALNGDDSPFFGGRYRPNMRVYRAVLAAASR